MNILSKRNRAIFVFMASFFFSFSSQAEPVSAERQASLEHLLIQDCGSCHGLRMKGGLGPPLLPDDLANKPKEALIATIIHGRPGTAMPPWNALLNEQEATWMIDRLLQGVTP